MQVLAYNYHRSKNFHINLRCSIRPKLKEEYKNFCELVEVISEQLLQFQANLLTTYILHDEQSQNWSSHQPYYEGERGSPTIQMWAYFLKCKAFFCTF